MWLVGWYERTNISTDQAESMHYSTYSPNPTNKNCQGFIVRENTWHTIRRITVVRESYAHLQGRKRKKTEKKLNLFLLNKKKKKFRVKQHAFSFSRN